MEIHTLGRQADLMRLASEGAELRRIADSAKAMWVDVDGALAPIIGARGVSALYKRSVNLMRVNYPWLPPAYGEAHGGGPFAVLGDALSQQSAATAAAANGALLQTFYDLLSNLIGGPLTTRLLRPALDTAPATDAILDRRRDIGMKR